MEITQEMMTIMAIVVAGLFFALIYMEAYP